MMPCSAWHAHCTTAYAIWALIWTMCFVMVFISWFTGSSVHPVVQSWSTQYHKYTVPCNLAAWAWESSVISCVWSTIREFMSCQVLKYTVLYTLYNSGWSGRAQVSLIPRSSLGLGMRLGSGHRRVNGSYHNKGIHLLGHMNGSGSHE